MRDWLRCDRRSCGVSAVSGGGSLVAFSMIDSSELTMNGFCMCGSCDCVATASRRLFVFLRGISMVLGSILFHADRRSRRWCGSLFS